MTTHGTLKLRRTLDYTPPEGDGSKVIVVSIGYPEPDPEAADAARVYVEIAGFDDPYGAYTYGVDSIQALLLAMGSIPDTIQALANGGRVTWRDYDDLGFRYSERA